MSAPGDSNAPVPFPEVYAACGGALSADPPTIHRDGLGEGPEVPLCDDCGLGEFPSCPTLWRWIAERRTRLGFDKAVQK